jgi:hypothetical protein
MSAKWEEDSESEMGSEIGGSAILVAPDLDVQEHTGVTPSPLSQLHEDNHSAEDEADYSSSDDESASSIAMLSLSSSIASLDLAPEAPSTPARAVRNVGAEAETPTPRKAFERLNLGAGEESGAAGDETPKRKTPVVKDVEEKKEEGASKRSGAGKKGSFWEFLYG